MATNQSQNETKKKLLKNESSDSIEHVRKELEQCQAAQHEWKERCARVSADLANMTKRVEKEKALWSQFAKADILTPLLSVIDDFDRAMEKEQVSDGIKMIHAAFQEFLKNAGVQEVSYEQFDPELHEALMQAESDEKESGQIIEVMQKGYTLGDKILRPAKVSVAT